MISTSGIAVFCMFTIFTLHVAGEQILRRYKHLRRAA